MHFFDCHARCHAAQVHELDVLYFLLPESLHTVPLARDCVRIRWYFDLCGTGEQDSRSFAAFKGNKDRLTVANVCFLSALDRRTARKRETRQRHSSRGRRTLTKNIVIPNHVNIVMICDDDVILVYSYGRRCCLLASNTSVLYTAHHALLPHEERGRVEWIGLRALLKEREGVKWIGLRALLKERGGVEWIGLRALLKQKGGVEWTRLERGGVEWIGLERGGVE